MTGIQKSFPGVKAIENGHLDLHAGEVLALMGENGAGKSTMIKVLAGAHRPDAGTIEIDGVARSFTSPIDAQRAGVAVIYQEFNLVPTLTVRENLFLGQERTRMNFFNVRDEHARALKLFARMNVRVDPEALVNTLTIAQQQCVEIAKALSLDARVIVMDEPSAALTNQEVEKLFVIIRDLQAADIGVIYVSHRMDEIFAIADRVTVMRDGQYVDTRSTRELTRPKLIEMMVGRSLSQEFPKQSIEIGGPRLVVKNLNRGRAVRDVSFIVRRGEVLGLTGLVGAGRTETARLIFGADTRDGGTIELDGKSLDIRSPVDAIEAGISLLTEDRKSQGLVLGLSVRENFGLPNLPRFSRAGFVDHKTERDAFAGYVSNLRIRVPHQEELAKNLSGGNQQKVVLAKWLEANADVIIFDEPTRGIDVGAKYEIYLLINELAKQGKAIVIISSELPEVLGMSDRVLVMHEGRVKGEITDVAKTTQEQVMAMAVA